MKPHRILLVVLGAVLVLWAGYCAYRAHTNLVTLNVRNMDVRRVVSKLEWQTWERIVLNTNVAGNVTLNVHSVPLEEVLNIVGLQTDSRWTRLYPIYSTPKSLAAFKQVLRGALFPAASGWSGLQQLAAWQQMGLGGFANNLRAENRFVSAQFVNKDLSFTALALSRFSKAQVVPEDGIKERIILRLQQVPFEKAVAKVSKQVHLKWRRVYTLQPLNAAMTVRQVKRAPAGAIGPAAGNAFVTVNGPVQAQTNLVATTNQVAATQSQQPMTPDVALDAITSTMTPEERQQTMDAMTGGNQAAAVGATDPSQPTQSGASPTAQAAQAPGEDIQSRIDNRLKNGTVDQRLAHDRRVLFKPAPKQ